MRTSTEILQLVKDYAVAMVRRQDAGSRGDADGLKLYYEKERETMEALINEIVALVASRTAEAKLLAIAALVRSWKTSDEPSPRVLNAIAKLLEER